MTADTFIDLVMSMVDELEFEDIDIQPMQNKIARYRAIGEAFEDCVKIKSILAKDPKHQGKNIREYGSAPFCIT